LTNEARETGLSYSASEQNRGTGQNPIMRGLRVSQKSRDKTQKSMQRFYAATVRPDLISGWTPLREWGTSVHPEVLS
jgi:hypothetical protein